MRNKGNIQKPVSIIRMELQQALIDTINNADLPAFVVEPILRDLYNEAKLAVQRQYENDVRAYEQLLESEKGR